MRILGYSERGIVSSLFNEIAFSPNSHELLSCFLGAISFPFADLAQIKIDQAMIMIEQSFSDFGDLDALLLFTTNNNHLSVFIEAKVKPIQSKDWSIEDEWQRFSDGITDRVSSSNLFTQLYHKVRLVQGLKEVGVSGLQSGLEFPTCSTKTLRKIGSNEVVLRAVDLVQKHLDRAYFISIIPEESPQAVAFFNDVLRNSHPIGFHGWDVSQYGYLTWEQVERFCIEHDLRNTLEVFDHNRGQIY
jgi:hypothetical protein